MNADRWRAAALPAARAAYGTALLLGTAPLIRSVTGRPAGRRARGVVRVLGARHLAQALAIGVRPGPIAVAFGVEVDLVHAASMFALAALARSQRRSGLIDAAIAASFATAGAALAHGLVGRGTTAPSGGVVGRMCAVRDAVARRCLPSAVRRALTARPGPPVEQALPRPRHTAT